MGSARRQDQARPEKAGDGKRKRASSPRSRWAAPAVGFLLALAGGSLAFTGLGGGVGCSSEDAPPASRFSAPSGDAVAPAGTAVATAAAAAQGSGSAAEAQPTASASASAVVLTPDAPYDGPLLGAMAFQTPIYPEPRFSDERLGYIRQGGKVPVKDKPIKRSNCKQGWYELVEGGYVCGKYATLDLEHPRVKLGVRQPDLAAILPYQYAYNRFHGTPLYKTLPTRDEMLKYEPYLVKQSEEPKKEKEEAAEPEERRKGKHAPEAEGGAVPGSGDVKAEEAVAAVEKLDTGTPAPEEAAAEAAQPKPWWQQDEKDKDKKPVVTLAELEQDADGNLSKRMVKGFFIAVDKTFGWNDRLWYRTTGGLLAPTDRMWINKPPEAKGTEWPEDAKAVFFMLSDKGQKYELSKDQKSAKEKGKLARHTAVPLTGKTIEIGEETYRESTQGFWVRDKQGTITEPGARPSDVGADEKWVDVNLTRKTLVLLVGDKPVYAALISPGKRSRNKKKDHATPTGAWRIREKHVAVTMDGDGASGDLPYSIEDVPYVAYFKGSYALHGAFWHQNFGREMSHGCVNLAPNDAKFVFNWVEPRTPRGWHGVFSSSDHPGSMVVIHE